MGDIPVVYKKEEYGFSYVSGKYLDALIKEGEITHFYRPAERRWISIKSDRIRGIGGLYLGPERRGIINRSEEEAQKAEENERYRSSNWLKGLWWDIGKL